MQFKNLEGKLCEMKGDKISLCRENERVQTLLGHKLVIFPPILFGDFNS